MTNHRTVSEMNLSRRDVLKATLGAGGIGLPGILSAVENAHHRPQAKHVIVLYMSGGYSHLDTFDPKPRLTRDHDISIGATPDRKDFERYLKAPLWDFHPNKKCGTEVSDLFPHLREVMHDAALIR